MPMLYFHLYDGASLLDDEGTDLIDIAAARDHAAGVVRDLAFKRTGMMEQDWSNWTMRIHDNQGIELFALAMSDFEPDDGKRAHGVFEEGLP